MSLTTEEWVHRAYKKLKHAAYFDKTQLPLVDKLVDFEAEDIQQLKTVITALDSQDKGVWDKLVSVIINELDILIYPKKLKMWEDSHVIFNTDNEPVEMERAQYFIDLPVLGYLLGVLWIVTIGVQMDDRRDPEKSSMYEHSYGNRLRKSLLNEDDEITFSPYLFEPYFSQYQRWRDTALTYAEQRLDAKQDALILTLDLRSFFYSVHIHKEKYDDILNQVDMMKLPAWTRRVHKFVYTVLETYSQKLRTINRDPNLDLGERVFLPIGFHPSNILSNWYLTPFDDAISNYINPVYYGRYVDDIIIVDKVEKNSELQKKAQGKSGNKPDKLGKLSVQDVIENYFCSSDEVGRKTLVGSHGILTRIPDKKTEGTQEETGGDLNRDDQKRGDERSATYRINAALLYYGAESDELSEDTIQADIQIQNDKVKVFYFREGSTRALLNCFRTEIGSHASEFRFLPDMDNLLEKNDYSEIFKLYNSATPNKLNGVTQVELDRFSLSKFLGKYRKAGNLIHDKKENAFDRDLLSIFDKRTLIENYTLWERLLEIMIVNDRLDGYEKLVKNIMIAIYEYDVPQALLSHKGLQSKAAFLQTIRAAVCRTSALCLGKGIRDIWKKIAAEATKRFPEHQDWFWEAVLERYSGNYRKYWMLNKYVLSLPIGWVDEERLSQKAANQDINLCRLKDISQVCVFTKLDAVKYEYYPYMITPQEISHALTYRGMALGEGLLSAQDHWKEIERTYRRMNYPNLWDNEKEPMLDEIGVAQIKSLASPASAVYVKTPHQDKLKVAIGNARLDKNDFRRAMTGKENRSFLRYQQLSSLFRAALKERVDLLVLPECYLPWEWIPDVSSLCARNGMALVTGVEPVLSVMDDDKRKSETKQKVYNLTAVILPYQHENYKYAHVVYHHKTEYSPEEKRTISGYGLEALQGDEYQLFCWKNIWFSVYCCYELASIKDRSLFQSYADITVAVEWNRDVTYFGSIMESMCRDIHCYCIQVNSSDYGDSRILAPSKTALRDIIQTKGGDNYSIMAADIDIEKLREHQRKGYELQRDTDQFKPTPPRFDVGIIKQKQDGLLWNSIWTAALEESSAQEKTQTTLRETNSVTTNTEKNKTE